VRGLRRLALLFHKVAGHFDLMETMTTRDYLSFRDKLSPASGFQSAQLREVEILMGLDSSERVPLGHEGSYLEALRAADGTESPSYTRVKQRLADVPSLRDAVRAWLYRTPIQGSRPGEEGDDEAVRGFVDAYVNAHQREQAAGMGLRWSSNPKDRERIEKRIAQEAESARAFLLGLDRPESERAAAMRVRAALVFIESYRELPLLTWPREVLDGIVALEQASLIFRQRHARMVERVIGRRTGTGGSAGVDYLDQTALQYRVFRDVWAVRTLLIQKSALPPLQNAHVYGFAAT
jgi:tryptophan 2,3-dioxygenase